MELTELINAMQEKGIIAIGGLKMDGKAKAVFQMINILSMTTDHLGGPGNNDWWAIRAMVLATDRDQTGKEFPMRYRLRKAIN
jgi:hypothetical protein